MALISQKNTVELLTNKNIDEVQMPENLALAMKVIMFRMKCAEIGCTYDYAHFAFGGSPFPVPNGMQEALKQHSGAGEYLPPIGIEPLRRQISKFWENISISRSIRTVSSSCQGRSRRSTRSSRCSRGR